MSFYNPHKNPFPFYQLEGNVWTNFKPKWQRNRCSGYSHTVYPGIRYFQCKLDNQVNNPANVTAVELRNVVDNTIVNIDKNTNVLVSNSNPFLVIDFDLQPVHVDGIYYVSIETVYGNFYSETFCVKTQDSKLVELKWGDSCSRVGNLIYPNGYEHSINIDVKIVHNEPEIEEETVEDGFGKETPTLQLLKQKYSFSGLFPMFLAEALSALRLHDSFRINNRILGESEVGFDSEIGDVDVKVSPEDDGCNALVEVTYSKHTIVDTSCCDELIDLANNIINLTWGDSETNEARQCTLGVGTTCSEALRISTPSGFGYYIEIQESIDNGDTWTTIGYSNFGGTHDINYQTPGTRLLRVFTQYDGGRVYSNVLTYEITD